MTASKSKNDEAWEIIFEEEQILDVIEKQNFFQISSARINQQREARLMTKFDHAVQLPQIFKDNNLTIQPISRQNYIIGAFESYFQLPKKPTVDVIYKELPLDIETIDSSNIYSESSAILCAFLSGMIDDVLNETTNFTVFGRMSTGTFNYYIQDTKRKVKQTISVNKSQCEIDGGFEGNTKFAIVEAKAETVNDFIVRQLYYPYVLWSSKIEKEVVPIFLTTSNDVFTLYRFKFLNVEAYNSIELVSEHRYCVNKSEIEILDIRNILENTRIIREANETFPQANSFHRIVDLLGRLYYAEEPLNTESITLIYAFDVRQTNYYVAAANYLGLVDRAQGDNQDTTYVLSDLAKSIMSQHTRSRNLELVRCILKHRIFNLSLRKFFDKAQPPTNEEIVSIMKNGTEKISMGASSTQKRRASTVERWLEWIISLPMTTP